MSENDLMIISQGRFLLGSHLMILLFNHFGSDNDFIKSTMRKSSLLNGCSAYIWYRNLTHWGRVMHICIRKLTIIGWDNGLSPDWRQAIISTNAKILLIWTLGTNFSEMFSEIHRFSFKKIHLKMAAILSHMSHVICHIWIPLMKSE